MLNRHTARLTWSTLRQAVEMLAICSCREMRSLTRSRRCFSSKPWSWASDICLSSWTASSKQRSLHLFTLLLFMQSIIIQSWSHLIKKRDQTCWAHKHQPGGFTQFIKEEHECLADIFRGLMLGDLKVLQTCHQVFKRQHVLSTPLYRQTASCTLGWHTGHVT